MAAARARGRIANRMTGMITCSGRVQEIRSHLRAGNLHSLVPIAVHNGLLENPGSSHIASLTELQEGGAHVLQTGGAQIRQAHL